MRFQTFFPYRKIHLPTTRMELVGDVLQGFFYHYQLPELPPYNNFIERTIELLCGSLNKLFDGPFFTTYA